MNEVLQITNKSKDNPVKISKIKCSICSQEGHNKRSCKMEQIVVPEKNTIVISDITPCDKESLVDISIFSMSKLDIVETLKKHLSHTKVKHEEQIMKLNTLKEAHVYCIINGISSQQYGPLLEKFIQIKFNYNKNKAEDCIGDCSKDGKNAEVKVSFGGKTHTKFNYVQIRPSHDCDTYILTAYHLSFENVEMEGELYIFKVPKEEIKKLIISYGGYAHGTIKEHGQITVESMNDKTTIKEYAIRPVINDNCWKMLIRFRIHECDI